ncbi:MAG: dihydroorotate dehydrogenase, partial [Spirochaetaceae bacterium]|nr:dihydroorotate dehydrogenase [Spirochaetaceae bacterium]
MSPPPEFGLARVLPAENPPGLPEDVFILRLGYVPQKSADGGSKAALPLPGRFYMLRPEHSAVLLGRPISLFFAEQGGDSLVLEFLIGQKGAGTGELRSLPPGSGVVILGPLGNGFPPPGDALPGAAGKKLLLIGGGLGIGPVAGFAGTLPDGAYDLWACFRSRPYGLHRVKPGALTVVTEDGSAGLRGALGDALGPEILLGGGYTGVYACGPEPMLAFVRDLCRRSALPCFLSMENRMACGMGVCLGCVIRTTGGNRRCCADGPVFSGEELIFPQNPGGLQKP